MLLKAPSAHFELPVIVAQMDSQADSASTASTADMDMMAGENGMDDLIGDSDAASFRYIRLVVYSARNVLCKDYSGFSDPYVQLQYQHSATTSGVQPRSLGV